jgi:hypothetical protein
MQITDYSKFCKIKLLGLKKYITRNKILKQEVGVSFIALQLVNIKKINNNLL